MSSLKQATADIDRQTRAVYGPHNERMVELLTRIEQTERRPKPGTKAPTFTLPSADGSLVNLPDLLEGRGAVLIFIRGLWCPYCNAQMTAFRDAASGFDALNLRVAVITPEVGGRAAETKSALTLPFEVLCDVDEGVALDYGCLFPLPKEDQEFLAGEGFDLGALYGNGAWFMPLATTFLIGANGGITEVFGGADQRNRPDPDDILAVAKDRL